ncbi:MAG: tRNA dihydrouridine synthase DusB [Cyanobacteria bacterium]|nr:tRNA dihydrouridine synthase DusB [Cyanobacteriota bacterium]
MNTASPTENPLKQQFSIGPVTINSRVMLAPMAGVTDVTFRQLVREEAPDSLICTEMISSNGLVYARRGKAPRRSTMIIDKTSSDHPIAYQLAAHQEDILIEAALTIIEEKNPDTIDLNMGCPVKKITGNFEGCALMKEPLVASKLISALVKAVEPYNKPITVKFRLGWDSNSMNYLEFGKMCQDSGASMITLHARTRAQGYQPGCKWEAFGELKSALNIPVIANGDINTLEDAHHIVSTYGVDGVMIGRGALGEPWLIGHIDEAFKTGILPAPPTLEKRLSMAMKHAQLLADYKGIEFGIKEMRKHLAWYIKGFPNASTYRHQLTTVNSLEDIQRIFKEILNENQLALAV